MNQTIDVAVQTNKDTEVSNRLDAAYYLVILVMSRSKGFPWIRLALLDTQ